MKRVLAFIVTISMLLMLAFPLTGFARAEQKVKLNEAIEIAKKTLDISTDNYNFNYNYSDNRDGRSTWDLNWSAKNNIGGSINVSIDSESGDIINYYSWQQSDGQSTSKIPKYSKEEAYNEVFKFLQKVQPSRFKETVLSDNQVSPYDKPIYSDTYNFNFSRQLNGLEFNGNGISISVDKNTLKIRSYNFNWDNGPFTDPSKAIGLEEAKKIFMNKLGIELSYNLIYDQKTKTQKPILVYTYKNGSYPIDAVTGDVITNGYQIYASYDMAAKAAAGSVALTPDEQKSVDASSNYISKEKALEEAQKYIIPDANFKLTNSNLYASSYDNSASWNFSWNNNDTVKQTYSYMNAQVDAISGKMTSFSMDGNGFYPDKDVPVSYTKEQAQQIAEKFISTLEPDKFRITKYHEVTNNYEPKQDKVNAYPFNYVASINGATCSFDSFNISINAYTGKVMSYYMIWNDKLTLPAADKAISLDTAYNTLYSKAKLNLKYIKIYDYTTGASQTKLAYVLDNFSGLFDANTGTFLDYNGNPIADTKKGDFTDIKGNPAEKDISILTDIGIIDNTESTFNPDGLILQKDFIKMLVKTLGSNYIVYSGSGLSASEEYDSYYDQAIQKNIITKEQKKPDSQVRRQDAVKMIVKAMGIGYMAEIPNLYNVTFKDASLIESSYKGYAAIASGLKIINPENNMFDGNKTITRGETATYIVNYLKVDTSTK